MIERRTVIFDADNVLLDFNAGTHSFMEQELGLELPDDPLVDYYPAKVLGKSREWEVNLLTAFQESSRFANLNPLPHAVKAVKKLQDAGCSMSVITACGHPRLDMRVLERKRIENLCRIFGENAFKDIHIIPAGESKLPYLQRYKCGYWAEDSISNALDGRKAGHRSFVVDCSHNRHVETSGLPRIKDLRPLVRHAMRDTYPTKAEEGFVLRK